MVEEIWVIKGVRSKVLIFERGSFCFRILIIVVFC